MKAKEKNSLAVSENGQEDKKYWISEDLEASRCIHRAVSSGITDELNSLDRTDLALVNRCSTERLEAALTGRLTDVANGFVNVTVGCINQLHGDVATIEFLMQNIECEIRPTEQAEALIHVCNRMAKSAKMIIEYETEKAAKSAPSLDDVRDNARVLNAFMPSASDEEDEFIQQGRLFIVETAAERLRESCKRLAYGRRTVA